MSRIDGCETERTAYPHDGRDEKDYERDNRLDERIARCWRVVDLGAGRPLRMPDHISGRRPCRLASAPRDETFRRIHHAAQLLEPYDLAAEKPKIGALAVYAGVHYEWLMRVLDGLPAPAHRAMVAWMRS